MGQETENAKGEVCKDFHKLLKCVKRLSDSQAVVTDWKEEDLQWFKVEICPNSGLYHGGKFVFKVYPGHNYPNEPPIAICLTRIYHPNIDPETEYNEEESNADPYDDDGEIIYPYTNVCISHMAEDWQPHFTFEECIQSLLFLFYEPNIDDPLSPLIDAEMDVARYEKNVKKSLLGLTIDSCFEFEKNYSLDDFDECVKGLENDDLVEADSAEICTEVKNTENLNKDAEVIETLTENERTDDDNHPNQTSVDLILNIEEKPLLLNMNLLPDIVHMTTRTVITTVCDTSAPSFEENIVKLELPSSVDVLNCEEIDSGLTIERDSNAGANSVIIDCDEACPDLPLPRGRVQTCISATMWMVKFFFTRILPEIYKS